MLEGSPQLIDWLIITFALGFIVYLLGVFLQRKKIISKRMFKYIYSPLTVFPTALITMHLLWPNLNFGFKILVALALSILSPVYFYFIWQPVAFRVFPGYKRRVEKDN